VPAAARRARAERTAKAFASEARLRDWIAEQNLTKGLAPVSAVVLAKLQTASGGPSGFKDNARKSKLQWLRRWRRRWAVSCGRLSPREQLTAEHSRAKVIRSHFGSSHTEVQAVWLGHSRYLDNQGLPPGLGFCRSSPCAPALACSPACHGKDDGTTDEDDRATRTRTKDGSGTA
jgi:hypothetical protein